MIRHPARPRAPPLPPTRTKTCRAFSGPSQARTPWVRPTGPRGGPSLVAVWNVWRGNQNGQERMDACLEMSNEACIRHGSQMRMDGRTPIPSGSDRKG
eukprot:scaffold810_cov355-Pavlova_lutheri.AAC.34